MKPLFHILLISVFFSCTTTQDLIYEDSLYVIRKYIGDFVELRIEKRMTCVYTTEAVFYIQGQPELKILEGARCYARYIPERMAGANFMSWVLYFTWDGTEDLYILEQDWITGEIY